ncbi:hypothetical protein EDC56_2823 [Sinobacterium caligoides]|uniref:Uncharacterized protein n=1 Tax=Sinobacterium caligoides TaxID=933926 RepID=A0A3N2DK65_9GAMM|nr:hypothetical protein [Sinobacterium caligoides]ROS00186.1 hypothetical protein EDC56_2823 [Sinobacterium caligoides]
MNKKLLILTLATLVSGNALAYNTNITNTTSVEVTIKAGSKVIATIEPDKTVITELNPYTSYAFSYQGQWAPQGLGTIQKYTDLVYQITPQDRANGRVNIETSLQTDSGNGHVDNVNNSAGSNVYGGICDQDNGGITCTLSKGDSLKQLNIIFKGI